MPPEGAPPLAAKLGLALGARVLLVDAPARFSIGPHAPAGLTRCRSTALADLGAGEVDCLLVFFRSAASLEPVLRRAAPLVFPNGAIWAAWPRRAAGHESDVTDRVVRGEALALGLVDVKVAALGEDWSGLRLVWRKELRRTAPAPSPRESRPRHSSPTASSGIDHSPTSDNVHGPAT